MDPTQPFTPGEMPARDAEAEAEIQRRVAEEIARREQANAREAQEAERQREQEAKAHVDQLFTRGYDGPPPWEIAEVYGGAEHKADVDPATGRPRRRPLPYAGPGGVTHNEPILTFGSTGQPVLRLAGLLAQLGYDQNTVARADVQANPAQCLDNTVMADVKRFCGDYGVANDVQEYQGREIAASRLVDDHVGPYIWQGLITAAQARTDQLAADAA